MKRLFARRQHWVLVAGLLVVLLGLLVVVASGAVVGHRFVIGVTGGQVSEGGLVLQSAVGQPVIGGGKNGVGLCSGFHAAACSAGGKVYLPMMTRPG